MSPMPITYEVIDRQLQELLRKSDGHRPIMATHTDHSIVMDKGKEMEQSKHEQLMQLNSGSISLFGI